NGTQYLNSPGNWESIIGYRQSIGSLTDDDLSVAPSDLDLRSAPPSEVDVAELPRFEPETDNLGEADDEVEEFEEDDEPLPPRTIIPLLHRKRNDLEPKAESLGDGNEEEFEENDEALPPRTIIPHPARERSEFDVAKQVVFGLRTRKGGRVVVDTSDDENEDNPARKSSTRLDALPSWEHNSLPSKESAASTSKQTSTSVGGSLPASGITRNTVGRGPQRMGDHDSSVKYDSAAKGKGKSSQNLAPRARSIPQTPAPPAETSDTGEPSAQGQNEPVKGPNEYAVPIDVLHRLLGGVRTEDIDKEFFPASQAARVENGRYTCLVRGKITTEGKAVWQKTHGTSCGSSVATPDSYRRHIIERHLGVKRGDGNQDKRIEQRIKSHNEAVKETKKKRKMSDDSDASTDDDRHQPSKKMKKVVDDM
ncbi:hypothetical protein PIIN_10813, partial [Serendipita indica DSM 11827]